MAVKRRAKRKPAVRAARLSPLRKDNPFVTDGFEFEGRVESINVKGDGLNSHQFLFSLVNRSGKHFSYLLDTSDSARYIAMVSLLTGAYAGREKVKLNAKPNPSGGPRIAIELETR